MYRMTPWEIANGWVNGYDPIPFPPRAHEHPRCALDRMLLRHLPRSPCLVAFSGGRDSSVVLAAAVAVARREGLALPVPITLHYPGAPDTHEAQWQRRVLEHLGVTERIVLSVGDEHDPIGPIAAPLLRRHGVLWPPNVTPTWRMLDAARGGSLINGEGGDEVFGLKRITPVTKVLSTRGRVHPRIYPYAARQLAPAAWRRRAAIAGRYPRPWLREPVERELARHNAADEATFALHAGRQAWRFATRRAVRRSYETMCSLGAELEVSYVQAFSELDMVAATAHAGGFWGWSGRTATMRRLFGDLLPREVLERSTKAEFTRALFTETYARDFARNWTGHGVDHELVDPEALRETWLAERPFAPTMTLLQQAWLAGQPAATGPAAG